MTCHRMHKRSLKHLSNNVYERDDLTFAIGPLPSPDVIEADQKAFP